MPIESQQEALRGGLVHHQSGRLQHAERIYRDVLARDQNCAPAWFLLGVLASQSGSFEAGVEMIDRAIRLGLKNAETYNNLGESYRLMGRNEDAISAFQSALQFDPTNAEAQCKCGLLLVHLARYSDAIQLFETALRQHPRHPDAHYGYGAALIGADRLDDAIREWRLALQLNPDHLLALKDLGLALQQKDRIEEALEVLKRLVEKYPEFPDGHADYAEVLSYANRYEEAIIQAKKAITLAPRRADLHNTLGLIHFRAEQYDKALTATIDAVNLDSNFTEAMHNVGKIHAKLENFEEAAKWFERVLEKAPSNLLVAKDLFSACFHLNQSERALALADSVLRREPNHPRVHFDRGMILLSMGRYAEGFEEYEWRVRCRGFHYLSRGYRQPLWDGSFQTGQTLLVYVEQGYGDIIQFSRYIPMILDRGMKVIIESPSSMQSLFRSISGVSNVILEGEVLPDFDRHIPLLSLPRIFGTTVETIPQKIPYFFCERERLDRWKDVVEAHAMGLKVGIVWGGNVVPDPKRTCALRNMSVLADIPGISWYSLQADSHRKDLVDAPAKMNLLDLGESVTDFADTAAIMSQLDLIITIDTAAAHLAGALGRSAWVLIPFVPDWRWFMSGDTTPWYPTLRLFRQMSMNDWTTVIEQVRVELLRWVNSRQICGS